jgi:hypothetical protein
MDACQCLWGRYAICSRPCARAPLNSHIVSFSSPSGLDPHTHTPTHLLYLQGRRKSGSANANFASIGSFLSQQVSPCWGSDGLARPFIREFQLTVIIEQNFIVCTDSIKDTLVDHFHCGFLYFCRISYN